MGAKGCGQVGLLQPFGFAGAERRMAATPPLGSQPTGYPVAARGRPIAV